MFISVYMFVDAVFVRHRAVRSVLVSMCDVSPHLASIDEHHHSQDGGAEPHSGQIEEHGRAQTHAAPDGRQAVPAIHLPALTGLHSQSANHMAEPVVRRAQQHL